VEHSVGENKEAKLSFVKWRV